MWTIALLLAAPAHAYEGSALQAFAGLVENMESTAESLQDATWTMHSVERVHGELQPQQTIEVKFRRPLEVYMRWTGDVGEGRELLYREGWNKDRMRVNPEGLLPPMNLDPTGNLAMRNARHPVMRTSILKTVDLFASDMRRLSDKGTDGVKVVDLGTEDVHGDPSRCMRVDMPRDRLPDLYADRIEACFSLRTDLLTRSRAYEGIDGELELVEEYEFEDMQVNVGLTDQDFDPGNPAYRL